MADERIEIEIVLDDGSVQKGFIKTRKEAQKTGRSISKSFSKGFSKLTSPLRSLRTQILGVGAALAGAFAGKKIIDAAVVQQNAVNDLNSALKSAGTFSEAASLRIQDFAASLEATTTVGDEAIIQGVALAQTYVTTSEEAENLTKTALDFAEAADLSFTEAVRRLGRAVQGSAGDVANFAPEIRLLTKDQLRAGEATRILGDRFRGAAEAARRTFSGAIQGASNSFGTLLENLGKAITESPAAIKVINALAAGFDKAAKIVDEFFRDRDVIQELIIGLAGLKTAFNENVSFPLAVAVRTFQLLVSSIETGVETIKSSLGFVGTVVSSIGERLGLVSRKTVESIARFTAESTEAAIKSAEKTREAIDKALDPTDLQQKIIENSNAASEGLMTFGTNIQPAADEAGRMAGRTVATAFEEELAKSLERSEENSKVSLKKIGLEFAKSSRNLNTIIGGGIGKAFEAFGAALVTGQNAAAAFGKAVLGIFGDILIEIGKRAITFGILAQNVPVLFGAQGAAAVLLGAAMVAAGGALKALAGGGAGAGGGGGGAAAPSASAATAGGVGEFGGGELNTLAEDEERLRPATAVTVNVQGNVLDRRETGLELVEVINEAFGSDGVTFARAGV